MNSSTHNKFEEIFREIPLLAEYHPEDFEITPINSYTNENYRLKNSNLDLILRLPRAETAKYINRRNEAHNEQIAFELELAPRCLWRDKSGISLTQMVPHCSSLTATDLRHQDIIKLVAVQLRQLHHNSVEFKGRINLRELLKRYFDSLSPEQQSHYRKRYNQALTVVQSLASNTIEPVSSHNDLNENNLLLDKDKRLWMIDWEYSSMASPYWDLATICNSGDYQAVQCRQLLDEYNAAEKHLTLEILLQYRDVLSVLNDCWLKAVNPYHERYPNYQA